MLLTYLLLQGVVNHFVNIELIYLPDSVPVIIDLRQEMSIQALAGGSIIGNWPLVIMGFVMLFFNILG
jgi:hypothetical protein